MPIDNRLEHIQTEKVENVYGGGSVILVPMGELPVIRPSVTGVSGLAVRMSVAISFAMYAFAEDAKRYTWHHITSGGRQHFVGNKIGIGKGGERTLRRELSSV